MPTLYLETTIPSYLVALPSRDLIVAANQQITHAWWETRRAEFDLVISPLVTREARAGDRTRARARLALLHGLRRLPITRGCREIILAILRRTGLPDSVAVDVGHIAIAMFHELDFLLTWNCSHIANAALQPRLREVAAERGLVLPVICTPAELLGAQDHEQ
jgi:hypothetical protein